MGVYAGPADWWTDGTNVGRTHIATKGTVQSGLVLNLDAGVSSSYPGSGTTWTDLSGNGNNGTLVNGVGYNSANGGSLVFDGVNDSVTLSNVSSLRPGDSNFTIESWIYRSGANGGNALGNGVILGTAWSGSTPSGGWIFGTNDTTLYFNIWSSTILLNPTTPIQIGSWYHIAVSRIGTSFSLYINSILESTGNSSLNANNSTYSIYIGRYYDPSGFNGWFNGRISNLKFYNNRALTAAEVQQNYNATKGRYGL